MKEFRFPHNLRQITQKFCLSRMRIWRYQSPAACHDMPKKIWSCVICTALSSKPQKPWCPWTYLGITVAELRPLAMLLFANYGKGPRDEWHFTTSAYRESFTFIRCYSKTTRLRHTNELQWTNWLPLTRQRYKALNITCMLCLCASAMAAVTICSIPIDFSMKNLNHQVYPSAPPIFFAESTISWCGNSPKVRAFGSVHHLFCLEITMIFRWSRYYTPLKLIAKAPEDRPSKSKRVNHRIPTIHFSAANWLLVSGVG